MLQGPRATGKGIIVIAAVTLALVAAVLTFSRWWPWAQELWRLFHAQSDEIQLVEAMVALLLLLAGPIIRLIRPGQPPDLPESLKEPIGQLSREELLDRVRGALKDVPFIERGGVILGLLRRWPRLIITGREGLGKTWEASELAWQALDKKVVDSLWEPLEGCGLLSRDALRIRLRQLVEPNHRVLVWLDNLPRHGAFGPSLEPHELGRLGEMLDQLREHCKGVYVVATARDEHLEPHHRAFLEAQGFHEVPLTEFGPEQTASLVTKLGRARGVEVDGGALDVFVERSETPLHTRLALEWLAAQGVTRAGRDEAERALQAGPAEAWELHYQDIVRKAPESQHLFRALGTLDGLGLIPYARLVLDLAGAFMTRDGPGHRLAAPWQRRRALRRALEGLRPFSIWESDGVVRYHPIQVEGRGDPEGGPELVQGVLFRLSRPWALRWHRLRRDRAYLGMAYYSLLELGNAYYRQKRLDAALSAYLRAVTVAPAHPWTYNNLGTVYDDLGRHDEAMGAYQKAIELDPKYAHPWNNLGNVYYDLGRHDEAMGAYQKAIELDPKYAHPWNNLGNVYYDLGRHDEAMGAYQKAIELDPKDAAPWYNLGNVYHHLGRHDEAMGAYRKAIELDPKFAHPWNNLGNVYRHLGRHDEAIEAYQKAIELDPRFAYAYANLADIYVEQGRDEDAIELYQKSFELQPRATPRNKLGYLHLKRGELDKAVPALEEAIRLDPNDHSPLVNLGIVRCRQGDNKAGAELFQRALELCAGHALYDQLSRAWLRVVTGEVEQGLKEMRGLLESYKPPAGLLQDLITNTELLTQSPQPPEGAEEMLALLRRS